MSLHQFPLDLDKGDLQPKLGIQVVVQLQSSFWSWGALSDENLQPGDVVLNLFDHRAQCFVLQLTRSLHNPGHFTCYLNSASNVVALPREFFLDFLYLGLFLQRL